MPAIRPFIQILRPINTILASGTVLLGWWIGESPLSLMQALLLAFAALCAIGFGNVINDIADIETDRIAHSKRPLVIGTITPQQARWYALILAGIALGTALSISLTYALFTLCPILLLIAYAAKLKSTPIIGNILVSVLVAYPILYGAAFGPKLHMLVIPAILAFLVNLMREIVKDIQDAPGDSAAGLVTTAILDLRILRIILIALGALYCLLIPLPFVQHHFGLSYILIAGASGLLQIYLMRFLLSDIWVDKVSFISRLCKVELSLGLVALIVS